MTSDHVTPDHLIRADAVLGEGIQWHSDAGLWWTDIQSSAIFQHDLAGGMTRRFATPERVGSFALIEGSGDLLCAFASGFGRFDPAAGTLDWLHRVEEPGGPRRFNDGRVDRSGNFWAGTMVEKGTSSDAALYRLARDGALRVCVDGVTISNGLCWSPDGRVMYFADSPARTIYAYPVDPADGTLGARRVFATTPEGAYPDGATVDCEGCLWSAQWGASRVVRYRPDGTNDQILTLPVSQPTCVAFIGPDLRMLAITTARDGLEPAALADQPLAGDILVYKTIVAGLPEMQYHPTTG
ncbi:MAG: SMP-30/gluconolactonase/LRE family protein [Sphingomonas sp.]|nr:SMP-30/gluconolactonase/LRE family protein [Sphingomonas sp.]